MATKSRIKLKHVEEAFDKAMLLADRDVVRLICATVLANQLKGAPVWLLVVSASSGGKSAILMTLDELEFVKGKKAIFFISDLTENTLASGFKSSAGDSSLLSKMPYGGMMIFKDLTSLLTKRREARDAVMGQLREVFDRKFDKLTGNNTDLAWKGKVGAIGGVTEAVYEHIADLSIMGDRFIMYGMEQPNRIEATRFVLDLKMAEIGQEELMAKAKLLLHTYLRGCLDGAGVAKIHMDEASQTRLITVADFATKVRSGVVEDQRTGYIRFVPSAEMPIRLIDQLLAIGTALSHMHMCDGEPADLTESDMKMLFKIAFDSIPIKRRWALRLLAKYLQGLSTSGLAAQLGYETEVVKNWLAQLSALGIARRIKSSGPDMWMMNDEYREVMVEFEKVTVVNDSLTDPNANMDSRNVDDALSYDPLANEFDGL